MVLTDKTHKRINVFGNQCAPILGPSVNGRDVIKINDTMSILAIEETTYPELAIHKVIEKYGQNTDGSLSILLKVFWPNNGTRETEIYLLNMDPCDMETLFSTGMENYVFQVITAYDLQESDKVYDQNEFLNQLCRYHFGFECVRETRNTVKIPTFQLGL